MTELKEAQAELARLKAKAQDLLKELMDVRFAIAEQQIKIIELIRQRSFSCQTICTGGLISRFLEKLKFSSLKCFTL